MENKTCYNNAYIKSGKKVLNLKVWACLLSPPNFLPQRFGVAIKKEKIITKQKALATSTDGNEKFPCLPYLP